MGEGLGAGAAEGAPRDDGLAPMLPPVVESLEPITEVTEELPGSAERKRPVGARTDDEEGLERATSRARSAARDLGDGADSGTGEQQ
jgi:hypothetical protein